MSKDARTRHQVAAACARTLGLPLAAAAALVDAAPVVLARRSTEAEAADLLAALRQAGGSADVVPAPFGKGPCPGHSSALALDTCQRCGAAICPLCVALAGAARCSPCRRRARFFRRFKAVRVALTPGAAARHIRDLGHGEKRLVFAESRARCEEIARRLEELGVRAWTQHSSVGKAQREAA